MPDLVIESSNRPLALAAMWSGCDDNSTAQLLSLADMIKARIAAVVQIAMEIEFVRDDLQKEMEQGAPNRVLSAEIQQAILKFAHKVLQNCEEVNLPQTKQKAQYIVDLYDRPSVIGSYVTALKDTEHLRYDFIKEIGKAQFLLLSTERISFFVGDDPNAAPFGKAVFEAFPSAESAAEIQTAG
jgi:hypothetical protein